jgi:hypothetical protein
VRRGGTTFQTTFRLNAQGAWENMNFVAVRIAVDREGFAWGTTEAGWIYRYDGSGFVRDDRDGYALDLSMGGDGSVWAVDPGGDVYRRVTAASPWESVGGSGYKHIGVDPDGHPWCVGTDGNIWQGTAGDTRGRLDSPVLGGGSPVPPDFTTDWRLVDGHALDIGAGADGSVWVIEGAGQHRVYRNMETGGIDTQLPYSMRIDVGPNGEAWVVREDTSIWHWVSGEWVQIPGNASDIGVGANGFVWVIDSYGKIYRRHANPSDGWQDMVGAATRLDVDHNGLAWVVQEDGRIYNSNGLPGEWHEVPGRARDIGVGADGDVWMADKEDGTVHRWNAGLQKWDKTDGHITANISAGPNGSPWGTTDDMRIWVGAATP